MKMLSEVKISSHGFVELPPQLISHLMLKEGDLVKIEWESEHISNKCFFIKADHEEQMFNEGFYCIPERVFNHCNIPIESIQILESDGTITLTTSNHLVSSLGAEVISCLMLQNVDLERFADDLADCINGIYEDEHIQDS